MRFVSLLQDHLGLPSKSQGSVSELQRHCLPLRWSISGIWRRKSHCSTRPIARIRPCIAWSFPPKATLRLKCESSAGQQPNVFSHCHSWYFLDLRHCPRTVKFPCYCLLINELFSVGDCNFPLVGRSNLFFDVFNPAFYHHATVGSTALQVISWCWAKWAWWPSWNSRPFEAARHKPSQSSGPLTDIAGHPPTPQPQWIWWLTIGFPIFSHKNLMVYHRFSDLFS